MKAYFTGGKSLWRATMNGAVGDVVLDAPVLDLGSGKAGSASYHNLIPHYHTSQVFSLDIALHRQPSVLGDAARLPFQNDIFATTLLFNALYLFPEPRLVLREMHRVMRPGGRLLLTVHFLGRVTHEPVDYYRFTEAGLRYLLDETGFGNIEVRALGAGAFTAALAQVDFAVPRFLRRFALWLALWLDGRATRRSGGKYRNAEDYPLGYLVSAYKP